MTLHRTFIYVDAANNHWNCTISPPCTLEEFQAAHTGCECMVATDVLPTTEDWVRYVDRGADREDKVDRFAEVADDLKTDVWNRLIALKKERQQ